MPPPPRKKIDKSAHMACLRISKASKTYLPNIFFLQGGFWAPKKFNFLKNIYILGGPPPGPPFTKKIAQIARNLPYWIIKGPIIYLSNFFFVQGCFWAIKFFSPPSKIFKKYIFFKGTPSPLQLKKMGLKVMGQFYGIKNDIFALSKHFFSQGGTPGGPLKNLNFFRGYIFLGAHKHPKK